MSLYLKYRPTTLENFFGNSEIKVTLRGMFKKNEIPHTLLFHGPTGTGKTTLARIVAGKLECSENNIVEIDTAQFRGIDTVRDLRKNIQYNPLDGGVRVYILDECFVKGTLITLANKTKKPIEDIRIGDCVLNLNGIGIVKNTFINKVAIERLIKINFNNGKSIVCSSDHLFLTKNGWVKAKNLNNCFVYLNISSNFVQNKELLNIDKNEAEKKVLCKMPQYFKQKTEIVLFNQMQESSNGQKSTDRNTRMYNLWKSDCVLFEQKRQSQMLQFQMREYPCREESGRFSKIKRVTSETIRNLPNVTNEYGKGKSNSYEFITTNENQQPNIKPNYSSENNRNKENQWNITYLERGKRWKWKINRTSNFVSNSFRLANGSTDMYRAFPLRQIRVSNKLQSRYRESNIENSNRSGWDFTQVEKSRRKRLEKDGFIKPIGVESVTFYQRGNNDEYFKGIITDKERNQGFIELYDFEVDTHHSYFANDILVHNCQKITSDAQNALLKILEDTPTHVYFILCTTDPQSLLPTIKGRCSQFQTKVLTEEEMEELLIKVAEAEGEPDFGNKHGEVLTQIIQDSQGHPRNALQILEQVLNTPVKRRLAIAQQAAIEQSESIALCRALIKGEPWNKVKVILQGLKGQDAEGIRRVVIGYAQSVLLSSDNERAALILEEFLEPTYNAGFPRIVYASYSVTKN